MTKPKLGMISLLMIGGAAFPWLIQRQFDIKTINSLQTQLDQLTEQRTEEKSSSNRMAQAIGAPPNDRLSELLRLRNEVNLLRKETNELSKLRAEDRRPLSARIEANPQRQTDLAAGDTVPIESLTFAGYATPEATFQSTFSAMAKGDIKTFVQGLTGDEEKQYAEKSAAELEKLAAKSKAHFAGTTVRIVSSGLVSEDDARMVVQPSAEEDTSTVRMRKINGEWKIYSVNR